MKALSENLQNRKLNVVVVFCFALGFFFSPWLAKPFCVGHSFIFVFSVDRYPGTLQFSASYSAMFGSDDELGIKYLNSTKRTKTLGIFI